MCLWCLVIVFYVLNSFIYLRMFVLIVFILHITEIILKKGN